MKISLEKYLWSAKYDPYKRYLNIDPLDYTCISDYLKDLRKAWKENNDPNDQLMAYPNNFCSEDNYISAINKEIFSIWKNSLNQPHYGNRFKYTIFDSRDEYFRDIRKDLRIKYDPFYEDYLQLRPANFDSDFQYLKEIERRMCEDTSNLYLEKIKTLNPKNSRKEWKEEYDPFDEYEGINPMDFKTSSEYEEAIEERMIWKEKYDPYNAYVEINPSFYDSELIYSEAIKERE